MLGTLTDPSLPTMMFGDVMRCSLFYMVMAVGSAQISPRGTSTSLTTVTPKLGENCTISCPPPTTSCRKDGIYQCKEGYFQFNMSCYNVPSQVEVNVPERKVNASNFILIFQHQKGKAEYYNITVRDVDQNIVYSEQLPNASKVCVKIENLQPASTYVGDVTSLSDDMESKPLKFNFTTQDATSGAISNFQILNTTNTSVRIAWSKPTEPRGKITGYLLEVDMGTKNCSILFCQNCNNMREQLKPLGYSNCSEEHENGFKENQTINYNVTGLPSFENITFIIYAYNGAGQGKEYRNTTRTKIGVATPPTNIQVQVVNSSAVAVTWTPPCHQSGPTNYTVSIFEATHRRNSDFVWKNNIFVQGYSKKTVTVTDLLSSWDYKFFVVATTSAGSSNSAETDNAIRTPESTPSAVTNLQVLSISDNYTAIQLTWKCPNETARNGFIKNYTVEYSGPDATPLTYGNYSDEDPCNETHTVILPVRPENNYSFTVFPNAMYPGLRASKHFYAKPGEPPEMSSSDVFGSMSSENTNISTDSSFVVPIVTHILTDPTNGKIRIAGLIVIKGNNQNVTVPTNVSDMHTWKTWREWKDQHYVGSYRPTPDDWLMTQKRSKRSVSTVSDNTYFTVGGDNSCEDKQEKQCNGPLPSDTTFSVVSVACTVAGCTASRPYGPFKTKPKSIIGAAVGGTFGVIVFIGVVIGAVLFHRRWAGKRGDGGSRSNGFEDEKAEEMVVKSLPRKIADFADILQSLRENSKLLLLKEWEQLNKATVKHLSKNAALECNILKNSYVTILAYDHTRVKLRPKKKEIGSDYINANYIIGYSKKREYIASQGPTDGTINDFWQMVWEQNVPIIVMLSGLFGCKCRKVAKDWPNELNTSRRYGDVEVEPVSYYRLDGNIVSVFTFRVGNGPKRTLKHFFLRYWPPTWTSFNVRNVIDFARYVRKELKPRDSGPILVHCSAGVGRTAVYICLDYFIQVIDNMDMDGSVDIFNFVLKMRDCRPSMIQTERQYVFIYNAVKEMIERKKRRLAGEYQEHVYWKQVVSTPPHIGFHWD